jgi:DNA helicase HerA-like ATPase
MPAALPVARSDKAELSLLPALANRHGLITGATGTGKTVTLQALAQRFSEIGVPVFMADVKGDLAGLAKPGGGNAKVQQRFEQLRLKAAYAACPVEFWDVYGAAGIPVRATVSDMGPLLLARLLQLNDVQSGVLAAVFKIADDAGLLLLDLKDLRSMLQYVADNAAQFKTGYGNVSASSVGAIQRALLALESQGAEKFFGEPMLDIADLMQVRDGKGVVSILAAEQLMNAPQLYATFLLWLLSELFEHLPEVGDPEKPKLVFFFDEAHLLFADAPKALLQRIEQVVRLIRSKGVGVYFVSQSPADVPESVLGQLGNRVQHALRAFTPKDARAVKTAAETLRPNPKLKNLDRVIAELGVGEALVSFLDEKGSPRMVERAFIVPPASQLGPISDGERNQLIRASGAFARYEKSIDRESAYEKLKSRTEAKPAEPAQSSNPVSDILFGKTGPRGGRQQGVIEAMVKSTARSIGSGIGREILRGVLGSVLGGRRRR